MKRIRPFALWPLFLVAGIVAFVVSGSDAAMAPDRHMSSRYLQSGLAP